MIPSIKGAPLLAPKIQYIEQRAPLVSMIKYIEARAPLVSMFRYIVGAPGAYDSTYRGEGAPGFPLIHYMQDAPQLCSKCGCKLVQKISF